MSYDVLGPYLISLMMSLSALGVFVWAVLAGALHGADEASLNFYRAELENDRSKRQADK